MRELTEEQLNIVLYGAGKQQVKVRHRHGPRPYLLLEHRLRRGNPQSATALPATPRSDHTRGEIERYMAQRACRSCSGARLRPEALGVLICGRNIIEVTSLTIGEGLDWVRGIKPRCGFAGSVPQQRQQRASRTGPVGRSGMPTLHQRNQWKGPASSSQRAPFSCC